MLELVCNFPNSTFFSMMSLFKWFCIQSRAQKTLNHIFKRFGENSMANSRFSDWEDKEVCMMLELACNFSNSTFFSIMSLFKWFCIQCQTQKTLSHIFKRFRENYTANFRCSDREDIKDMYDAWASMQFFKFNKL